MHHRPKDVVERRGARDLAAEVVEILGPSGGDAHRLDLRLEARGEIADDRRDHEEEDDGQHVFAMPDDEGVVGSVKKKM